MKISQFVRSGTMELDTQNDIIRIKETGQSIFYTDLQKIEQWGTIYEKFVGQVYEREGCKVIYRMVLGFNDAGVDLECENDEEIIYVQCKFISGKASPGKAYDILRKARNFLNKQASNKVMKFVVVTPDKEINFRQKKGGKYKDGFGNHLNYPFITALETYPLLQSKIKISYREIRMDI